jgi:hypothetical protein
MFRSILKIGFQRLVAMLLLVTFAPIAILSEAAHLIPGLGEKCHCFRIELDAFSSIDPIGLCKHDHSRGDYAANGIGAKSIEASNAHSLLPHSTQTHSVPQLDSHHKCPVCEFCSMFNSTGYVPVCPLVSGVVSEMVNVIFHSISSVLYSQFSPRAPPLF